MNYMLTYMMAIAAFSAQSCARQVDQTRTSASLQCGQVHADVYESREGDPGAIRVSRQFAELVDAGEPRFVSVLKSEEGGVSIRYWDENEDGLIDRKSFEIDSLAFEVYKVDRDYDGYFDGKMVNIGNGIVTASGFRSRNGLVIQISDPERVPSYDGP